MEIFLFSILFFLKQKYIMRQIRVYNFAFVNLVEFTTNFISSFFAKKNNYEMQVFRAKKRKQYKIRREK